MPESSDSGRDAAGADTCRVCRTVLAAGTGRCSACGAVHGEGYRCPHCGAIADTDSHPILRQRCRVCGGPRVPAEGLTQRSGAEVLALTRAARARSASLVWRLGAITVMSFALVGLIVSLATVAVANGGILSSLLFLFLFFAPGVGAFFAWRQGVRSRAELRAALDQAWSAVTDELLVRHGGELTAEQLAERLHTSPEQAEALLARLGAEDRVRMRVTDEGQLLFSMGGSPRVRVAPERAPTDLMEIDEVIDAARASGTLEK